MIDIEESVVMCLGYMYQIENIIKNSVVNNLCSQVDKTYWDTSDKAYWDEIKNKWLTINADGSKVEVKLLNTFDSRLRKRIRDINKIYVKILVRLDKINLLYQDTLEEVRVFLYKDTILELKMHLERNIELSKKIMVGIDLSLKYHPLDGAALDILDTDVTNKIIAKIDKYFINDFEINGDKK